MRARANALPLIALAQGFQQMGQQQPGLIQSLMGRGGALGGMMGGGGGMMGLAGLVAKTVMSNRGGGL